MIRNSEAQGSFEYMLLIAGAVVIAIVVVVLILGITNAGTETTNESMTKWEEIFTGGGGNGGETGGGECWQYKRTITLSPSTPESDFQVKVELTTSNFDYSNANSDGSDIRFYDSTGNELNYWVENWDTSGTSTIWVKVPTAGTSTIDMNYGNSVALSESNKNATMNFFETGTLSLSTTIDGGVVQTVNLGHSYSSPAVVAYIATRAGGQSVDVRVRNVGSSSFEIFMEEPDDGGHAAETVNWIVVESGSWKGIDEQLRIEAGTPSITSVHTEGTFFGGETVTFSNSFSSTPSVLATLNTYANGAFMSDHTHSLTTTDFIVQQEAAGSGSTSSSETIGWIAFSRNTGTNDGINYKVGYHPTDGDNDGVDNTAETISYSFGGNPSLVIQGSTGNGGDGYWARGAGTFSSTSANFYAEEDQVGDTERNHIDEAFSWVAFYSQGDSAVVKYSTSEPSASIGAETTNIC